MPLPVIAPSVATLEGELYVFGGSADDSDWTCGIDVLQIYDPQIDKWRLSIGMSVGRCYSAAAVFEGSAYVFGGFDGAWRAVASNE